ncbi:MAG: radical SAM protein [Syntrophus sp. (in: bacteria)]|nr:radical SAM protein [Syntrophus sp. (in: bacteria)]
MLMQSVLLIHPPLVKPGEPPAGLARLAGVLKSHHTACTVVDANLEGLLYLLNLRAVGAGRDTGDADDTWTKRACRHLEANRRFLSSLNGYNNMDRYKRAVLEINRVLAKSVPAGAFRLSLSDYEDRRRSPVSSPDLIAAAKTPSDNPFYAYFKARFPALLDQEQPFLIGFSLNYLSQALCCFAMIGFMRQVFPAAKIVLGGGLVTSWIHRPDWRNPFEELVDELIAGPGEAPLLALLGKAPGAGAATPDYSAFPLADYLSPGFILPYSASSGCYWRRCAFCPEKAEANAYKPVSDDQVISDLAQWRVLHSAEASENPNNSAPPAIEKRACPAAAVRHDHDPGNRTMPALVHLTDNALRPSLLRKMTLNPPGIPWYGFARITKELTDPEFCLALRSSGCVMLKLGIESGSQKVLDELEKGIDLKMAADALKTLHQAGIATYVYLLFGTPPEQESDALQTLDFVIRNQEWIDFLNVAIFNLPAFGADTEKLETGDFYEGDLSLYRTFSHPYGWDRPKVRQFLGRVFKRHPAVSAILKRDPPFFTSNHAPFFGTFRHGQR